MCRKRKKEKIYDKHSDLINFEKEYKTRIDRFLRNNPETRIVFLNADFGWGKTTFVENNLKVKEECIYSPWLNKSDNYLEEIYYNVTKQNIGKKNSWALFISTIVLIISITLSTIFSILIEIFKDNYTTCKITNSGLVCTNNDSLLMLLISFLLILLIIICIVARIIFKNPVPIVSFFRKDSSKNYEKKLISLIVEKIDDLLVIEDIDRTDDIEEILIAISKISDYIKKEKLNKYILVTGNYARTVSRINNSNNYYNNNFNELTSDNKGIFLLEKIISLKVEFLSIKERIENVLLEKKLSLKMQKIEYDEIISFIKNRNLSIRFFLRFLDDYKYQIEKNYSLYHLLLKYYQEEKYYIIDDNVIDNSLYNLSRFPICLNDIEMLFQCGTIMLPDKSLNSLEYRYEKKGNYDIINNIFYDFFNGKKEYIDTFKVFFTSNNYPILMTDGKPDFYDKIQIGKYFNRNGLKTDLENYLIGKDNNDSGMNEGYLLNKRCYFDSKNSSNNYNNYVINEADNSVVKGVSDDLFAIAYIACFFRDNIKEIQDNYPKIYEYIEKIIK